MIEENEEIVARKANLIPAYAAVILMGLGVVAFGVYMSFGDGGEGAMWIGIIVGGVLTVFGAIMLVLHIRTPKIFISYKDGKLHLADGTECYPHEITDVTIHITRTNGIESATGAITFKVHGRAYDYKNIKKIRNVELRLKELYNLSYDAFVNALMEEEYQKSQAAENGASAAARAAQTVAALDEMMPEMPEVATQNTAEEKTPEDNTDKVENG